MRSFRLFSWHFGESDRFLFLLVRNQRLQSLDRGLGLHFLTPFNTYSAVVGASRRSRSLTPLKTRHGPLAFDVSERQLPNGPGEISGVLF
jgi:hypothetical protein